jgi:SAM-dependent methyltransferase
VTERTARDVFEKKATFAKWDDDYYTPIAERFYDAAIPAMLTDLGVTPGALVLDAGCGPGVHAIRAAKAGAKVRAIDFSATALAEAAARVERAGVASAVTLEQADLTALPFDDGAFRAIFSWGVIIHIPEVDRALKELARILGVGGRLAFYVLNGSALDPKIERLARTVLGRPQPKEERLALGTRTWFDSGGEMLCLWRFDVDALTRRMAELGLVLRARRAGELSELQRRLRGRPRAMLQRINNVYARAGLPARLATANLLVFERPAG